MGEEATEVLLSVPHVRQLRHWDCGLACMHMVLGHFGKSTDDFDNLCKDLQFGDSVWTIDLANILNHYHVDNHVSTVTVGVDKGYSKKSFYRDRFETDEQRVNNLFENAEEHGLSIQNRSVTLSEILDHLKEKKIIVILVDWSHLSCNWCGQTVKCLNLPCISRCLNVYQGHFIVVVGFNTKDKTIYYKNPSYKEEVCCCSMKSFEIARKSYGTDEDILFVDSVPSSAESMAATGS
ncbi:hypothetical protein CAPTEDRAFT_171371 [Capitella teleta]|uniref:Protein GUCD1 n=1 Tax=Capitella teleta TaxID=283909 RepID=R7THJ0_CAPTE|nr:hypothetical protein CAPTEDRAFT_171371 [Capitella teleta]|eukprot:ELT90580.1 hypothetical protein CAPTEDRAFT_171371 [Capitella teleta]